MLSEDDDTLTALFRHLDRPLSLKSGMTDWAKCTSCLTSLLHDVCTSLRFAGVAFLDALTVLLGLPRFRELLPLFFRELRVKVQDLELHSLDAVVPQKDFDAFFLDEVSDITHSPPRRVEYGVELHCTNDGCPGVTGKVAYGVIPTVHTVIGFVGIHHPEKPSQIKIDDYLVGCLYVLDTDRPDKLLNSDVVACVFLLLENNVSRIVVDLLVVTLELIHLELLPRPESNPEASCAPVDILDPPIQRVPPLEPAELFELSFHFVGVLLLDDFPVSITVPDRPTPGFATEAFHPVVHEKALQISTQDNILGLVWLDEREEIRLSRPFRIVDQEGDEDGGDDGEHDERTNCSTNPQKKNRDRVHGASPCVGV